MTMENRTKVTPQQTEAIANIQYTKLSLSKTVRLYPGSLAPRSTWVRNRIEKLLTNGATPGELNLLPQG